MYKYTVGDYARRMRGDYYGSYVGDPGILSGLGRVAGKLVGKVLPKIPGIGGVIGTGISIVGKVLKRGGKIVGKIPGAGAVGTGVAIGAGAAAAEKIAARAMNGGARVGGRRINPLNPKALRRSTRRLAMFRGHATKALRELGYTVQRSGTARATRKRRKAC